MEWIDTYHIFTWMCVHELVYQEERQARPASEEAKLDLSETQSALNTGHQNTYWFSEVPWGAQEWHVQLERREKFEAVKKKKKKK